MSAEVSPEFFSALAFLGGVLFAMVVSCLAAARGSQLAQEIVKRGHSAEGKVLKVWRPPVAGSFARIYFEFQPPGLGRTLRCCHVDRRSMQERVASLPPEGASVRVSYLPENPTRAVIAKLVSRFTH